MKRNIAAASGLILVTNLFIVACLATSKETQNLESTLNAQRTQLAELMTESVFQDQVQQTQAASKIERASATPTITLTPVPSSTPTPTSAPPSNTPTEPPSPSPTETPVTPTETQPASSGSGSQATVVVAETPKSGQQRIRVENNSGKEFKITLVCSGGPCQGLNPSSYNYTFPPGLHYFWVWAGRYKITWTICEKTETFEHPLNGQWYIKLKLCK